MFQKMNKINVIGTTGSGKTTFSSALAQQLQIEYIEIDKVYWKPNWREPEEQEFLDKLSNSIIGAEWVLDGNYSRARKLIWESADTVIWLDYGYFRTLWQLVKRSITRSYIKQELWAGTGNSESFSRLFSKNSIILWFFRRYHLNRRRLPELISREEFGHIKFIKLTSPQKAKEYLVSVNSKDV